MLSKLVGKGVALGSEYREHRKEVKLSRENSPQEADQANAGPSTSSQPSRHVSSEDPPPSYTEVARQGGDRSLASGQPVSDDKKGALAQYDEDDSDDSDDLSTEDDEADWELDEVLTLQDTPTENPPEYRAVDELVRDVLTTTNGPKTLPANFDRTPLPCPVIIPQRRPRTKQRGFVRAYAPLLGECSGIDQDTFLTFLGNFYKASQASPVWTVIQISAGIAGLAPSVIAMAVTNAVQVAAGVAKEVQARHRTNDFLDRINEELFKPAGLFAMIVKYKTAEDIARSDNSLLKRFGVGTLQVDFNTGKAVAKYDRSLSDEASNKSMSDRMNNLRLASGTTRGAIELPEAAPLMFPDVDKAVQTSGPESFQDKTKDAKMFLGDYLDRRAQMEYSRQDPSSGLMVPEDKRTMKSSRADPNHPMYQGGLISLASGGHLGRGQRRSRSSMQRGFDTTLGPATYGRPSIYDSSRLYSSSDVSYRDSRRYDKRERRTLRTEQRLAEGRRVGRKRERRYENFLYEQEAMRGGDAGRSRRGPIGMLIGVAGDAIESRRQVQGQGVSNAPAPHAPYGGSSHPAPSRSNPPAPYGGSHAGPAGRPQAYAVRARRGRQQGGGPLGMVKRIMREDVLYLMIVNMPSEAELAEAREALASAKNGSD